MRFIEKDIPDFFKEDTKNFKSWNDYNDSDETKKNRIKLKEYILTNEQKFLCVYCECKVNLELSHIEHLKPKEIYSDLTFDYNNLVVSCNGQCLREPSIDMKNHRCGHKKNNKFDEDKFLNPIELEDIDQYFNYDFDDYKIISSDKNKNKSSYMIDLLQLNEGNITLRRQKTLESFNKYMKKFQDKEIRKAKIKEAIETVSVAFVSLIKAKYSRYLD